MKKFCLYWIIFCLLVTLLPKFIDRITPKTIIKEVPVWRVKEVIKEVPVFKGEKIVEKEVEKIVYQDRRLDIFQVSKIDEDNFIVTMHAQNCTWEFSPAPNNAGVIFKKCNKIMNNAVTANTALF